jgi:hypothetical protein
MPSFDIDPFENHYCASYSVGQQVIIAGTNFEPDADVILGIYYISEVNALELQMTGTLVLGEIVTTDTQGGFSTSIRIESSHLAGSYRVVSVAGPEAVYCDDACGACYQVK